MTMRTRPMSPISACSSWQVATRGTLTRVPTTRASGSCSARTNPEPLPRSIRCGSCGRTWKSGPSRDRGGSLGIFQARHVGGKIHIGLPLAQTVLTEAERNALPRIFTDAGLDPGSVPSDRELRRVLALQGRNVLRRQTIGALDSGESRYVSALLDVVSAEFADWDGVVAEPAAVTGQHAGVSAALRMCLRLDEVAGAVRASVRCLSKKELPDDGLELTPTIAGARLTCSAFSPVWSHPLANAATGADVEPALSVWRDGLTLNSEPLGWTLRLRSTRLRVFVDGRAQQLPDLVETRQLSRDTRLYLAFHEAEWSVLQPWVENECDGWHPISIGRGLPTGWMLGSVERARTDTAVRKIDEDLAFPDRLALRLVGGVRAAVGSAFFEFAPPRIVVEGAMPGDTLVCNEEALAENGLVPGEYDLPPGLPLDARLTLEVRSTEEVVARRSLYLVTGFAWRVPEPLVEFDGAGTQTPVGTGIAGAAVRDMQSRSHPSDFLRTPGLDPAAPRVYFVGRKPDEITLWPTDPVPDWDAVWAIPFGRRGTRAVLRRFVERLIARCGAAAPPGTGENAASGALGLACAHHAANGALAEDPLEALPRGQRAMVSRGDAVLFAVAAKRRLSWSTFTEVLDAVFVPDERIGSDVREVRSTVAALGDSLAHWDVVPLNGSAQIIVSPPVLALLPRPGLPTAVLCGSRSPDTMVAVATACRRVGAEFRCAPQAQVHPYAPALIEVTGESAELLAGVASALNIGFGVPPPAWQLAVACVSLTDYLKSLIWTAGPEINWIRQDFDPQSLRFANPRDTAGNPGLRMSAYVHPDGWVREDRLWCGDEFAKVDRNWGRYAVLADRGDEVCQYDHRAGTFTFPRSVPLPKIAARAAGLCSGRPPRIRDLQERPVYQAFEGVSRAIAAALISKLRQDDTPATDLTEDAPT